MFWYLNKMYSDNHVYFVFNEKSCVSNLFIFLAKYVSNFNVVYYSSDDKTDVLIMKLMAVIWINYIYMIPCQRLRLCFRGVCFSLSLDL